MSNPAIATAPPSANGEQETGRRRVLPRIIARVGPPRNPPHTTVRKGAPKNLPRMIAAIRPAKNQPKAVEVAGLKERLENEESLREHTESQRRRSRVAALAGAAIGHVVLALLAMLVIVSVKRPPPPLIEALGTSTVDQQDKSPPPQMLKTDRVPTTTTASMISTITSATASPIALPDIDVFEVDDLDIGIDGTADLGGIFGAPGGSATNFLGIPSQKGSNHVVLLIDVSGSMRGNCGPEGIAAIKKEVAKTINGLPAGIRFNLFTFAGSVDAFEKRSVYSTAENKRKAIGFFDAYFRPGLYDTRTERFGGRGKDDDGVPYVPIVSADFRQLRGMDGGTRIELGLIAALQDRPATIFVISDGEPASLRKDRTLSDDELIDLITEEYREIYRMSGKLQVNTVSVDGLGARFLRRVARQFRGHYKSIRPSRL